MRPRVTALRLIGVTVGIGTALLGIALAYLFLWAVEPGAVGETRPFTTLTASGGVSPPTAATWTYFDAHGVRPTITFETDAGTDVLIVRSVLGVLAERTDHLWLVGLLAPALLVCGGALAATLACRFDPGRDRPVPTDGLTIVLGYWPALGTATWLATVPVARSPTGEVRLGTSVVDAETVAGVTAGPTPLWALCAAFAFPLLFGLLGGLLARVLDRARRDAPTAG